MKKINTLLILSMLVLTACTVLQHNNFKDSIHNISFSYPEHWEMRHSTSGALLFAANFDYIDGLSEDSSSTELEGTLRYDIIPNFHKKDAITFYKEDYEKCINQPIPEGFLMGPICLNLELEKWENQDLNGNSGYISEWEGIPASGELGKRLIIDANSDYFIQIMTIRTSLTDEDYINDVFDTVVKSLKI